MEIYNEVGSPLVSQFFFPFCWLAIFYVGLFINYTILIEMLKIIPKKFPFRCLISRKGYFLNFLIRFVSWKSVVRKQRCDQLSKVVMTSSGPLWLHHWEEHYESNRTMNIGIEKSVLVIDNGFSFKWIFWLQTFQGDSNMHSYFNRVGCCRKDLCTMFSLETKQSFLWIANWTPCNHQPFAH